MSISYEDFERHLKNLEAKPLVKTKGTSEGYGYAFNRQDVLEVNYTLSKRGKVEKIAALAKQMGINVEIKEIATGIEGTILEGYISLHFVGERPDLSDFWEKADKIINN